MVRDQPRWSVYLHWLLVLDVELLVKALVTTWETIPTGQKRRQSETECLVSILFSKPSLKTCLHRRNKQNICYKKHVQLLIKTKSNLKIATYLAAKRSITRRWIQAEARVISLENIFAIPDNCKWPRKKKERRKHLVATIEKHCYRVCIENKPLATSIYWKTCIWAYQVSKKGITNTRIIGLRRHTVCYSPYTSWSAQKERHI